MAPPGKQLGCSSGSNAAGTWRIGIDGEIRQSGEVTLASGTATVTFPIPFLKGVEEFGLTAVLSATVPADCAVYLTAEPGLKTAAIGGSTTTLGIAGAITGGAFKVRWRASGT